MTKLIPQLNFSSSISSYYDGSAIEIEPKKSYYGDGASLSTTAVGSKRSALSASDAECFSLCLGAGPLWYLRKFFVILTNTCTTGGPDVPADASAPPGGVNSGASSPATPSTPTHDDNNRDLLSTLLWASASSLASSAESLVTEGGSPTGAHPALQLQNREATIRKILERKEKQPVKIEFKIFLTENTVTRWDTVVGNNTIYLRVPGVLQAGSKEGFMLLLDFAEERLGCNNCIICVHKERPDRSTLFRTFMFMGFQILPPNAPLLAGIEHPEYVFLHYNMQ